MILLLLNVKLIKSFPTKCKILKLKSACHLINVKACYLKAIKFSLLKVKLKY